MGKNSHWFGRLQSLEFSNGGGVGVIVEGAWASLSLFFAGASLWV